MGSYAVDLKDIRMAMERISAKVHRTPLLTSQAVDEKTNKSIFFKAENFQKVGAFKIRGALNAVSSLTDAKASNGVVTHSSGNFAQAVALSARFRAIPAYIVMPENAPAVKRRAVQGYGAEITDCVPTLEAREDTAAMIAAKTGATFLHPYDQAEVIAGQGTVGMELFDDLPELDAVVVPVGGGGLISGIALAMHELAPNVRIFGAEPSGADDAARSKAAGKWLLQTDPNTIADGLLTSLGELTWPVVRDLVEHIIVVDDEAIVDAMKFVWERMKIIIEPSAATAVAAAFSPTFLATHGLQRIAVVLSGGNVDLHALPWLRQAAK